MNPLLSVIIPVYKVEDYLVRCVKSVIEQDYTNIEVILVDDGSPDRCPQICDELATQDNRITVIHKKNGGLSSARNAGIEVAKGKYIAFLDSDDQWAKGKLKPLMEDVITSGAQMTMFASKSYYEDKGYFVRADHGFFSMSDDNLSPLTIYPHLITNGNLREHACTKILSTSLLRDNSLYFKEGILGEDTEWSFRLLRQDLSIHISPICLYIYTEGRIGSIVNTVSAKSIKDALSTIQSSIDYYKEHSLAPTREYELAHCAYLWSIALGNYHLIKKRDKANIKNDLKRLGHILDIDAHPKSRKVGILYRLFGIEVTSYILSIYIKMHKRNIVNKKIRVNE